MRIEDLDRGRVRAGVMEAQLADLRWLGLDWDEGPVAGGRFAPYLQSERQELYRDALERLASRQRLFSCNCSRREIAEAASAPHGDEGPRYPGTCRATLADDGEARPAPPAALRFRVEPGPAGFKDLLQGPQSFDPGAETGDFVIRRKDGVAAYQLAVVVDDAAMQITHVVRGADLLSSTARQVLLYDALGLEPPQWLHVPLLLGPGGERLSKREGAITIREVREAGTRPEALAGWLAATCGLAEPAESLSAAELIPRFDIARLPREATMVAEIPFG
jgi:glutamyl-tRNA synthetase